MLVQNKRFIGLLLATGLLLLIPLITMHYTEEVDWNWFDFLIAGMLFFGTGLVFNFVLDKVKEIKYRVALCVAILIVLLLIWAELAVGIFGTPFAGA